MGMPWPDACGGSRSQANSHHSPLALLVNSMLFPAVLVWTADVAETGRGGRMCCAAMMGTTEEKTSAPEAASSSRRLRKGGEPSEMVVEHAASVRRQGTECRLRLG